MLRATEGTAPPTSIIGSPPRPGRYADAVSAFLRDQKIAGVDVGTDCGMGREGTSRKHALYKIVALVLGANFVRRETGTPEARCLAADPRYSPRGTE